MCGIIAVVRQRAQRAVPTAAELLAGLDAAVGALDDADDIAGALSAAATNLEAANELLMGFPGLKALLVTPGLREAVRDHADALTTRSQAIETDLDERAPYSGAELEAVNADLIRVKDALWGIARDRLRTVDAVADLAGSDPSDAALEVYLSVQQSLSAMDRLEVRGRDSAGLHLLVHRHGLDVGSPSTSALIADRSADPLFGSGSVRVVGKDLLSFVYKAAAEIGELGDNTKVLRAAIQQDELLRQAIQADAAEAVVLGHTRWASVGIISEPNAHPLNSEQQSDTSCPYVTGALNGDVDNYADLMAMENLSIAPEITTDAKVIPTLTAKHLADGDDVLEAFRRAVSVFEGSVAIATNAADAPDHLQLALRGSGQALYVGLAEDAYIVASEPYGVVEETRTYLRMDGETPGNPDNPNASRGQIIDLRGELAGTTEGIIRRAYDGTALPVDEAELVTAEITTRDIDRGHYPHYLLKEISESPSSFRKTLRGKIVDDDGQLRVNLSDDSLPGEIRAGLVSGAIAEVLVIGQGTAAIAGQSLALALAAEVPPDKLRVEAIPATELSGFRLRSDMSDSLVIALSQSGTTTDTNRTVELVRARGAKTLAIVNRRNSDLTDKVDGVLYTSDGRDVEMSVASTKAFYSQVAAGFLLSFAIADAIGVSADDRQDVLESLRSIPEAMQATIATRDAIATAAADVAPSRRYWAVVGNGPNLVAARELRIKLSELCYKSMAADATEDKKHIDLSSEPLILICAAGLVGSTADDVAKEVAIFRAHKAAPVVIANEGEARFGAALHAIAIPVVHSRLAFVLSTVVGHLFGYEAARAIDAQAQPLREARAAIEGLAPKAGVERGDTMLRELRPTLEPISAQFFNLLRAGELNGHLEASTATRIASLFRFALGDVALESYQREFGKIGTPSVVLEDLVGALSLGIEELTRPIDAIKHQAKTVTVGISRSDETLLEIPLARAVLDAGAPRDRLSYGSLRTLADLDPAVEEVLGYTRYALEGVSDNDDDRGTVVIVDRGGIALNIPSRADRESTLRGTKHQVAMERKLVVAKGARDGRSIIIVPEVKDNVATGLMLLHVRFAETLPTSALRGVLQGYRNRLSVLRDAVTETEPTFRDDLLATIPVIDLLTLPIAPLAERWRN